jgi:hypothetical protein
MTGRPLRLLRTSIAPFVALLALMIGFAAGPAPVLAQDATGKIVGTVTDPQSALVPGVEIVVTNTGTGVSYPTMTDRQGYYQVLALPIGNYTVRAVREGFRELTTTAYKLLINQALRIDLQMEVGARTQVITVEGQASGVETVNPTLGQSITSRQLVNLPLNGRDVLDLALLQPGVTESNDDNGGAGNYSIAGNRTDSVTFLLDGGLNNDLLDNSNVYDPNPDTVAEFRLLTSDYTAEYGRNGGGIISVVTKSGTNQLHGSAFEYLRNDAFNANTFFNNADGLPKEVLKRNQFGGTFGGPITIPHVINGRDRFFFFVGYQGQRQVQTQTATPVTTFTPQQLTGDFSDNGNPDPNVAAFLQQDPYFQSNPSLAADAIIDPSKINSVAQAYIKAGLFPTSPTGLYASQGAASDNRDEITSKLDFNINTRDHITATLGFNRNPVLNPFPYATVSGFPDLSNSHTYFSTYAYTHTFSPTLLNEARVTAHRTNYLTDHPDRQTPTPSQLGIGITPDRSTGITNLFFDTGLQIGFSENGPTDYVENTFVFADTLTWVQGKNTWKFGASFSPYQENLLYDFIVDGEFDFYGPGGIGSGNSLADFLLGIPYQYFQGAQAPSNVRSKATYAFAQDEWHARRNLVLTLGLRYEYSTPKSDTQGRTFSIMPGHQSVVFPGAPVGLVFPGDPGAPTGVNFPDKTNFAPRFGFAWDPKGDGKTSVRGGWGLFYDILKAEDNLQFNGQPPFVGSAGLFFNPLSSNPTSEVNYLTQPFVAAGVPNSFPSKPPDHDINFANAGFLPFGSSGFVYYVDPHLKTPYIYQYDLSVQRELAKNLVWETSYVGSSSHGLTALQDVNPMVPGTIDRVLNLTPGNSSCTDDSGTCSFATAPEFKNISNANYNSLETSLTRQPFSSRFFGTTYFTLAYTYAHSIDNASGFRQRNSIVPTYAPDAFRASSDADIRHRIVFSGGWDVPFDHAWHSGPRRLTQGWSLYPIITYRTGFPIDVNANLPYAFDYTATGPSGAGDPYSVHANLVAPVTYYNPRHDQTLNGVAGSAQDSVPNTGSFWFNPGSFSTAEFVNDPNFGTDYPQLRTYGTLPRNALRGPSQSNFDLALAKTTPLLGERLKSEFRIEAFNVLNHAEWATPDTNVDSATFGQIISTGTFRGPAPRILQLALRLTF